MDRKIKTLGIFAIFLVLLMCLPRGARSNMLLSSAGDDAGDHADLVVRKVVVTPARAHVGDVVMIEMVWQYWGDLVNNYYETTFAEVTANGRVVARKPFDYRFGAFLGDVYRETFLWDTKDAAPGTYRIRGEVPLRLDATPYDNYLVVKEPLVLLPAGEPFPAGQESGGSAVAENPFWLER